MTLCRFVLVAFAGFAVLSLAPASKAASGPRVFIRASEKTHGPGEHDYPRFLAEWTKLLNQRGAKTEGALRFPTREELLRTDVLILYAADGGNVATPDRVNLENFLRRGGGMVVLHDGICGSDPAWFASVAGGAKLHGETNWQRGLTGLYFDRAHPITEGVSNFDLDDELFYKLRLDPGAKALATTFRTAKEIIPQWWTHERGEGRVVASCQGHYYTNFALPHFRGLILRAVAWAGKRPVDSLTSAEERASFRYPAGGPSAPADAIKKIRAQPEFNLSLVAAEPLTPKPISLDWDARGRMWVALTPEYPFKTDAPPGRDSIVILEDANRDGRMDKSTVFADDLVLPTSFVFHRDGVIVAQAPQILLLRDVDGDGKAERREALFSGFGTYDTHAVINNLRWGLDGWVYGCQGYSGNDSTNIVNARGRRFGKIGNGIFRFRPDGSAIEQVASYNGNSWGIDFNWEGELFFSKANGPHLSHVVMPERYLARGKIGSTVADKVVEDHQKVNPIFTDPRHEYVQVAPVGVFTAASGCTIYEGGAWPEKYRGCAFVCEPTVHIVHEDILFRSESPTFDATRRDEAEFIAGRDLWFRPVHTRIGPDGAMYLLDFYNQAVSHNDIRGVPHGPGNAAVRPDRDHVFGRIYRIQHKDVRLYPSPSLARAKPADLVHAFEHPNAWVRLTAQRLLTERPAEPGLIAELGELIRSNRLAQVRLHALWTLFAFDAIAETNLLSALTDAHPSVVNNALRVVAELRQEPSSNVIRQVVKLLKDTAERTRLDALLALTAWPPRQSSLEAVQKLYPDLKDGWAKSAVLGIARMAPTNFIRLCFASDKADSFRDIVPVLVEDFLVAREEGPSTWTLGHLGRAPGAADKLKISTLATFNKRRAEFAPPYSTNVQAGIERMLKSENRSLRAAALPVAAFHHDRGEYTGDIDAPKAALLADLSNDKLKDEERAALLTSLMNVVSLREEVIAKIDALLDKKPAPPVQKAAITELGRVAEASAGAAIIDNWKRISTENKAFALGTVVKRQGWALALCDALEEKKLTPADLGVSATSRLETHPDPAVAARARAVFHKLNGPRREKDALIAQLLPVVNSKADVKAGKDLFEKHCVICHKFGDKGKDLGPELTGVGLNGSTVLLTHILDPNRVVEGNFVAYNASTKRNEDFSGLIKTENRESVTLKNLEGEVELRRADIESLKSSGLSLMPEGYEALGDKALRDIVAYLTANTPKGFRTLDMAGAFTADSRRGLFESAGDTPSLSFKQFGVVMVDNIPFNIVNPATLPSARNVTVLRGGSGFSKTLAQRVEFSAGTRAVKLYVLGGVAGWGFPYGPPEGHNVPAAKITLHYTTGATEEILLRNGEQFADYTQPFEAPASKAAPSVVSSGQVRWFALTPQRSDEIAKIVLESFDNHIAPVFVAMTAQVE